MAEDRAALFVRIPTAQSRHLDARARALGRTKQDLVSELLGRALAPVSDPAPAGGPGAPDPDDPDEVLTLTELGRLLKLDEASILDRVRRGELPGRRFGDQWRFSRRAVLAWLDGPDPVDRPPAGFRGGAA